MVSAVAEALGLRWSTMRAVLLCCALAGCFSPAPQPGAPCSTTGECPRGLFCSPDNRCESTATDAMTEVDACPAVSCEGDDLVGCGARTTCEYGCAAGDQPHCKTLAPSNGLTHALLEGANAEVSMIDLDFNTNDGSITRNTTTIIRPAGEGVIDGIRFTIVGTIGVWSAKSWTSSGAGADDWKAVGANEMALFAMETINVGGQIDVGGQTTAAGPGASSGNGATAFGGCRGRAGRSNAAIGAAFGEGGGGGGAIHGGGDGGASNQAGPTGIGGSSCATSPQTIPLAGGNAGGHGGQSSTNGGGGGGGGLMLVALDSITITGIVGAPGAGGLSAATGAGGGGGGGSGGAILLEAPEVNVAGSVTANGGGGGAPAGGNDGGRGSLTATSAAVGAGFSCVTSPGATPVTRRGGAGGTGTLAPTDGTTCTVDDGAGVIVSSQGGGGGGAAGRIEIKRLVGSTSGVTSPPATVTTATVE
jgi:hypothetical protein